MTKRRDRQNPYLPWLGGHYNPNLKWSDGQSVSCYHNFTDSSDKDYVNQDVTGNPQCLILNRNNDLGRWGRNDCDNPRPHVCKIGKDKVISFLQKTMNIF